MGELGGPGGHLHYLPPRTPLQGGRTKERKRLEGGGGPAWTEAGGQPARRPLSGEDGEEAEARGQGSGPQRPGPAMGACSRPCKHDVTGQGVHGLG